MNDETTVKYELRVAGVLELTAEVRLGDDPAAYKEIMDKLWELTQLIHNEYFDKAESTITGGLSRK